MSELTVWEKIENIRKKEHPTIKQYIPLIFTRYMEFHGDRLYGDDAAITGGIAKLGDIPVTVLAHVKGNNLEDNKKCNFGMPHPEGYRKALRLAKQAEKFHRPIVCFIDTSGAFCGIGAEERGQGEAIARNIMEFMDIKTPVISIVTGEGGSGGALALGVCDQLAMLENAVYSVISPRGCASILWKDASREKEAAEIMKITAKDLKEFGVCDTILEEPCGGAHTDIETMAKTMQDYIVKTVCNLSDISLDLLLENRYNKFRKIGQFIE